jgi:type I restriction enzyme S subunit
MQLLKSFPVALLGAPAAFNQDIKALLPTTSIRSRFLAWSLRAKENEILRDVETAGHGTGRLSTDVLRQVRLRLPALAEQDRIVALLDEAECSVEIAGALRESSHALYLSLTQRLIVGMSGVARTTSASRTMSRMRDAFTERDERGRPDLRLLSITAGRGVVPRENLVRRDASAEDKSRYKRIAPGDIGYNTMRMWQGVSGLSKLEGIVSPAYTVVTPREDVLDAAFAAHLFKCPPMIHRFRRLSQGLVDDTLNLKFPMFAQVQVELPKLPEQRAVAAVLDSAARLTLEHAELADALREQRRALMDQLLGVTEAR